MILLDSNIIIYAAQPAHAELRQFLAGQTFAAAAASYVEVLGYHRLSDTDRTEFETFFAATTILLITSQILDRAVKLRQTRKIALGDSLIAATALVHSLTLATRNTPHFAWIDGLVLLNPMAS